MLKQHRNPLWLHAEDLGNSRFRCNYCKRVHSGGVTRLKFHLSGLRGNDVEVCSQAPSQLQAQICLDIAKDEQKRRRIEYNATRMGDIACGMSSTSREVREGMSFQPSTSREVREGMSFQRSSTGRDLPQTPMPENAKKMGKSEVDDLVATFFIQNNIAFNVVQQKLFIDLIKGITEYGPTYELPDYSNIRTKIIPRVRKRVDEYVEDVMKSWNKTGCSIILDTCSDTNGRCFINFIAHSPRGLVFLQSVEISEERKTSSFLKELSSRVIDMVGPEHVVQFIIDNASNFDSVGDILVGKYPTMYKTKCVAHGIEMLLKDIYERVPWLQSVVDNAKIIQSYMNRDTVVTSLMREATNGRELKKACATRFASNFLVLESILLVENELKLLVASSGWRNMPYSRSQDTTFVTELIQDSSFWSQGREVIQVLKPLIRIIRLVDGEGSTTGYLFQAMEMAKTALKIKFEQDEEKYGQILTLFDRRRKDNIIHPIHAFAATLDPSYMTNPNFKQTWEMKEGLYYLFEHVVKVEEKDQFMKEYRDYLMKLPSLFNSATYSMMKTYHPRIWWEFNGDLLPVLQKYAIRILSQPCSSSSCKRNWTVFEVAQTKKQRPLTPDMLGLLVYCRMNTMLKNKFEDKVLKDADAIDWSKLDEWPDYGEEIGPCVPPVAETEKTSSTSLDAASIVDSAPSNTLATLTNVCVTYVDDEDDFDDHVSDFEDYGD